MEADVPVSLPIACVPGAIPTEERSAHFALIQRLFGSVAEAREPLVDGYTFHFPAESLEDLGRFILNERRCCPFLTFELIVPPGNAPVDLRVTGPEGTRALLEAELPI